MNEGRALQINALAARLERMLDDQAYRMELKEEKRLKGIRGSSRKEWHKKAITMPLLPADAPAPTQKELPFMKWAA